eukprot:g31900.t1
MIPGTDEPLGPLGGAAQLLRQPHYFLNACGETLAWIDEGKLPEENVEAARAVRDALPLSATAVRAAVPCGAAAGQLCEWVMAMLGGIRRTSTSDCLSPSMALPDVTGDAMRRLGRLSACGQALQEILATIPPTPLETGGQAEANVLQHHLGCSGRFREALQICAELKTERASAADGPFVTPGDKIYLDPSVVPALLSTRKPDRGRARIGITCAGIERLKKFARAPLALHLCNNMALLRESIAKQSLMEAKEICNQTSDHKALIKKLGCAPHGGWSDLCDDVKYGKKKYQAMLQEAVNNRIGTIVIDLDDVEQFCKKELKEPDLHMTLGQKADRALGNVMRYRLFFYEVCDALQPARDGGYRAEGAAKARDAVQCWRERLSKQKDGRDTPMGDGHEQQGGALPKDCGVPAKLKNPWDIRFKPRGTCQSIPLRQIRAESVGALIQLDCLVVNLSQVKPKVEVVTYHCETCGSEIFQSVEGENYTPPKECPSQKCRDNKQSGNLRCNIRTSAFTKHQDRDDVMEHKIQEALQHSGDRLYEHAAKSIAPEIFGALATGDRSPNRCQEHPAASKYPGISKERFENVRLCVFWAVVKKNIAVIQDGLKIRGDIHTLMMGDPGVAKSQLLKQVCAIAPRSVYTTGKGSTGVGLTATVNRDNATGEVTLEGGSLVLADMGVCCIDETTILAAANPVYGRYNPYKSPVENIDLPAALLSRFDLVFLLLDTVDCDKDKQLAEHVTKVHSAYEKKEIEGGMELEDSDVLGLGFKPYNHKFMRAFVRKARSYEPVLDDALRNDIADAYVAMRDDEKRDGIQEKKSYTTPRTLLAIMRLSQAHARARFSNRVERQDFDEAMRLMKASKDERRTRRTRRAGAGMRREKRILADLSRRDSVKDGWVDVTHVVSMAGHKALTKELVMEGIESWQSLGVVTMNPEKTMVQFLVPVE